MGKKRPDILGFWRITGMEVWDRDYIDAEVEAYLRFDKGGYGEFQFAYVTGWIDYRLVVREGTPGVEWSWEGNEETNEVSGRGWAVLGENGHLRGRIFIHDGDDSAFEAKRGVKPGKRRGQRP